MAAATRESNVSRYPSEKSVKEALDMLKPPGILSKVGFSKNFKKIFVCEKSEERERVFYSII